MHGCASNHDLANMAAAWEETSRAARENRRELVLSGKQISSRIQDSGFDEHIFDIKTLNFLEISNTCLTSLSEKISQLSSMVNLVCRGNQLTSLPSTLGQLRLLKLLDVSSNRISAIPNEINELINLESFDASNNQVDELPDMKSLNKLAIVNFAGNKLKSIESLFSSSLPHLSDVVASRNDIDQLSGNVDQLHSLKRLDLHDNMISELPVELASCHKLKECLFQNNKFKDKRLEKLVKQCKTKAILDYVRTNGKQGTKGRLDGDIVDDDATKSSKPKVKKNKKKKKDEPSLKRATKKIKVLPIADCDECSVVDVVVTRHTADVRPYIVCCIVRNVDLESGNHFKQFLTAQTKLHDSLCAKRTRATIATHDLAYIKTPVKFDAVPPAVLKIIPLGKQKEETALSLVSRLNKEADELRRQMKRSSVSGVHKPAPESPRLSDYVLAAKGWSAPSIDETKIILYDSFCYDSEIYLDLLKDKQLYPCVTNADDQVISFPPITNSNISKISTKTKDLFIEVTSSTDLKICKQVMDSLLKSMLDIKMTSQPVTNQNEDILKIGNIEIQSPIPDDAVDKVGGTSYEDEKSSSVVGDNSGAACRGGSVPDDIDFEQCLKVQQVRVSDIDGNLKVLYPSRVDLNFDEQEVFIDRPTY